MNKKENKCRPIVKGVGKSLEEAKKYESNSEDERRQPKKLKILSLFRNSQESSEDDKRMKKLNIRTVKELDKETNKKKTRRTAVRKSADREEKTKGASTYTVLSTYTQMQPTENDFEDENVKLSPCPTNINVAPLIPSVLNPTHGPILNLLYKLGLEHNEVMKEQWKRIDTKIEIKASDCQAYNENKHWNQEKDWECLDINRVKINDGYVHASYFEQKEIARKFILSQIPIEETKKIAAFWQMIYQENLRNVYVLCGAEEKISGIFPILSSNAESVKFGNLQVRKIEESEDLYIFDIYKSDSPFRTRIQFVKDWPENELAQNRKKLVSVLTNFVDDLQANNIAIISRRGTGRAATFLAISYGCYLTKNGTNFNLKKICRAIRKQRPGAISNYSQFVFIYSMIFQYSLQNITDIELKTRTQKTIQDIDLILKNE